MPLSCPAALKLCADVTQASVHEDAPEFALSVLLSPISDVRVILFSYVTITFTNRAKKTFHIQRAYSSTGRRFVIAWWDDFRTSLGGSTSLNIADCI
jgi:hypothetical protein